jgi:hypothetical protein
MVGESTEKIMKFTILDTSNRLFDLARTSAAMLTAALLFATPLSAQESLQTSKGQSIYLPVYSHLWHGNLNAKGQPEILQLSALISIRNSDPASPIRVTSARYYDTNGKLLREFVPTPRTLAALATLELFVERREAEGGSGANFLIRWQSDAPVSPPVAEAIHSDLSSVRTVSFVTNGRPVRSE